MKSNKLVRLEAELEIMKLQEVKRKAKREEAKNKKEERKMMQYHVAIPYYYHFYVEAETEEEALEKAHNTEGKMGEYDDSQSFVEEC